MLKYKKIPVWQSFGRLELLNRFRSLVVTYFDNQYDSDFDIDPDKDMKITKARRQINSILDSVYPVICLAGVNPIVHYASPPIVGGMVGDIDLIHNIFNLYRFGIGDEDLLDIIDRAIGVYMNDRINALLRTINPIFWLGLLLDYVISLLFRLLGKVGFDQEKIESSTPGRITKTIFHRLPIIVGLIAGLLTILEIFGYLNSFKSLIRGWIG